MLFVLVCLNLSLAVKEYGYEDVWLSLHEESNAGFTFDSLGPMSKFVLSWSSLDITLNSLFSTVLQKW